MNYGFLLNAVAASLNFGFWAHTGSLTNFFCGVCSLVVAAWCFEV